MWHAAGIIRTLLFQAAATPLPYDIQVAELIQVRIPSQVWNLSDNTAAISLPCTAASSLRTVWQQCAWQALRSQA